MYDLLPLVFVCVQRYGNMYDLLLLFFQRGMVRCKICSL